MNRMHVLKPSRTIQLPIKIGSYPRKEFKFQNYQYRYLGMNKQQVHIFVIFMLTIALASNSSVTRCKNINTDFFRHVFVNISKNQNFILLSILILL